MTKPLRSATALLLLVLPVWGVGFWYSVIRAVQGVREDPRLSSDLADYERAAARLRGVEEAGLLIERSRQRRFRALSRGQFFRAQYVLAPVVLERMTAIEVAELRARTTEDLRFILHFFVTAEHRQEVERRLGLTAQRRGLEMTTEHLGGNLALYRIERP